jgi:hypothetical protein
VLEDLRRRTDRSGLEIILLNVWEGRDARTEAMQFCELWGIPGTVLVDEDGSAAELLGVRGVPTNIFVAENGVVMAVGASTPAELEATTRRLLGPDAQIDPRVSSDSWHWQQDPMRIEANIKSRSDPSKE